ncbi:MAG: hypothetical protein KC983_06695 [Phycisphaerales bacterium]|nr:hypothetical protein [Phycisphaerales bacterium]
MTTAMTTRITLRALDGTPLDDVQTHDMVVATARAIAERHGIDVLDIRTTPTSITVHLRTGRIESLGFAAELRRLTTNWYTSKYDVDTLWGEAHHDDDHDDDASESWKNV